MNKIHYCLIVLIVFVSCQKPSKPVSSSKKPNIIILYADDMGFGDLEIQNPDSKIPTPYLNQLAKEGLLFTDAHSSSGICTPSRYALLTGKYHWRDFHGIVKSMEPSVFKENQITLPKILKSNGYYTAAIGKWHLGWDWESIRKKDFTQQETIKQRGRESKIWPAEAYDWDKKITGGPLSQGFDYYFGDGTINFPPYTWIENDKVVEKPTITLQHPKKEFALEGNWELRPGPAVKDWDFYKVLPTLTQSAVEFVKSQEKTEKPFFLYMAFPSPHAPIIPNKEFIGKSKAGAYGDFVVQTDDAVGQILETLEKIKKDNNTIIIFTSDNGPEHYAYQRIKNFEHNSSNPFRGVKRDVYEGGHHVPFIVKWADKIKPNSVSAQTFSQIDILKTLAIITNSSLPKNFAHDSYDFSKHWLGDTTKVRTATVQNTFKTRYALRKNDWLYINDNTGYHSRTPNWVKNLYKITNDSVQLFNLEDDIAQKNNVAKMYPEKIREMEKTLKEIKQKEIFTE